ncbi:hypothetical protein TEK04_01160 [Klenkia sp. LSe6-5]|uniref:YD repeat-containing protein n=1 Tax=Klenkia sesuvii TaxID=3103137 RepID=A0ABU8DR38_9ACTN
MALRIRMTRTAQDASTVSYRYGPTWEDQPRSVMLDRDTGEPVESTDLDDRRVASWLRREQQRTGEWIPKGQIIA